MSEASGLKRTVLYDIHVALGARMGPFGGYEMPIQYEGILKEHENCRQNAALFDTCHMGEFRMSGPSADRALEGLLTCEVASLAIGQCRYGLLCNENGGVIDDLVVYRTGEQEFMVVVNAGTQDGDFEWIRSHIARGVRVENASNETSKIDLQGPAAPRIMQRLVGRSVAGLTYYHFAENRYRDHRILVSRTGYTGEIGFELYFDEGDLAQQFWKDAMTLGAVAAGLGARDTLRLEMGMPLYGHELSADRNAAESGFKKAIASHKNFVGAGAVRDGGSAQLVGIRMEDRRAARQGDSICDEAGHAIGAVTSGSFAPSLGRAIALAYVTRDASAIGSKVRVQTARQELAGTIEPTPFYKEGTARKSMVAFL